MQQQAKMPPHVQAVMRLEAEWTRRGVPAQPQQEAMQSRQAIALGAAQLHGLGASRELVHAYVDAQIDFAIDQGFIKPPEGTPAPEPAVQAPGAAAEPAPGAAPTPEPQPELDGPIMFSGDVADPEK